MASKITTKNHINSLRFCLGMLGLFHFSCADADDPWVFELTPQVWSGKYQGSLTRNSVFSYGFFLSADYLQSDAFTFSYNHSEVTGKSDVVDLMAADVDETSIYLSANHNITPHALPGKLTLRLDVYSIKDKTTIAETTQTTGGGMGGNRVNTEYTYFFDDISAGMVQVEFIDADEGYYLDLAYAASSYDYDTGTRLRDNDVQQLTPSIGFGFNDENDWVQLRAYIIYLQHGDNTQGQTRTKAMELQWSHELVSQSFFDMHSIGVNTVFGERIHAVDPDAAEVYSLSDRQNFSVSVTMNWQTREQSTISAVVGYDQYTDFLADAPNVRATDDYSLIYTYLNISYDW